jgi:putative alpha-1,2-mannosidase
MFPEVTLHLGNGKTFVIEATGTSPSTPYVVGATLNGKPLDRTWFRHEDIMQGGRLELMMAAKPGAWPSGEAPPSSSDTK